MLVKEKNYCHCIDCQEVHILQEQPYNWKKHFIHQLPEMLIDVCKLIVIFVILQLIVVSVITTAIMSAVSVGYPQLNSSDLQSITERVVESMI